MQILSWKSNFDFALDAKIPAASFKSTGLEDLGYLNLKSYKLLFRKSMAERAQVSVFKKVFVVN